MLTSLRQKLARAGMMRDEDGSILIFVLVVFSIMMLVGGSAIDLARHENSRSTLQYNLDRAVLAAASLKQTQDPEIVVRDYMSRITMNEEFELDIDSHVSAFDRTVSATARADVPMWFLSMAGINKMQATARSEAAEKRQNIEISLVLDVSGSMGSNSRLVNLKVAAKEFVNTILADAEEDSVAISIIPFTSNVAPSQTMFDALSVDVLHNLSTCLDFPDADFAEAAIDPSVSQAQGIYTSLYGSFNDLHLSTTSCNDQDYFKILPYASDANTLHAKIDSLEARGYTAGHVGIKWGLAMLDPKFQSVTDALILNNEVDSGLTRVPVAYDDPDTQKVIVMMSDGANTYEFRMSDQYRVGKSPLNAVSVAGAADDLYFLESSDGAYYLDIANNTWITSAVFDALPVTLPNFQNAVELDWADAWGRMPTNYYGGALGDYGPSNDYISGAGRTGSEANPLMTTACDTASTEGVIVYSIGFEMSDVAKQTLKDCASTASHFYDANGTEITEVFQAIANSILKLKLTN